jgi:hypothetical protein
MFQKWGNDGYWERQAFEGDWPKSGSWSKKHAFKNACPSE